MAKKWMILLCLFSVFTFICSLISTITVISNENARTALNSAEVLASNKTYKNTKIYYQFYKRLFDLNKMIEKDIFLMYDIYIKSNK